MTLYEINKIIENVLENCIDPETGEIADEELMVQYDSLQLQRDEKAENICCFIKNLKADAAAIKEEAKKLTARAKAAENKAEHLEQYLGFCLHGEKLNTPRASVSYRRSQFVEVEEGATRFLPDEYIRIKDPEPDKVAIKAALKEGKELPGCYLVDKVSMIIK